MRFLPLALIVAGVTLAVASTIRERDRGERALAQVRDREASAAVAALHAAIERRLRVLASESGTLAANEQLRMAIATDAQTVQNQLAAESMRSIREHEVYVIGRMDTERPGTVEVLASRGIEHVDPGAIRGSSATKAALKSANASPATDVLASSEGFVLVAAASLPAHDEEFRGYLLIGETVSRLSLPALATETHSSLLLSDGGHALAYAGSPNSEATATAAIGAEAEHADSTLSDSTGRVAARAVVLAPHAAVWVASTIEGEGDAIARTVRLHVILAWLAFVGAAIAGAVVIAFLGRRKAIPSGPAASWAGATESTLRVHRPVAPPPLPIARASPPIVVAAPVRESAAAPSANGSVVPGVTEPLAQRSVKAIVEPPMFGRYRLLDRLGSGGMAEVWTAVVYGVQGFRRPFVVKRIRRDMSANIELVQSFIDEANLASQFVHSNIVPVFDFGNLNGEYFLAQEYILGRDLSKVTEALVARGRQLDPAIATYVLAEALQALEYAHSLTDKNGNPLQIVHRDISPGNILCSMRGEVKLIDFGIAKSTAQVGHTATGMVKGNLHFMSPEQAQGTPVGPRSDLFSLAMSIFFAQSGKSMYQANSQFEMLLAAAKGPLPGDVAKIRALPHPLGQLLENALAPDPANRYGSAKEFLEVALPKAPIDGGHRLAALLTELFGDEFREQERRFEAAANSTGEPSALPQGGTLPRVVPHEVFISHSSRDKVAADAVCAALEARGISCWIAPRNVQPGKPYGAEIIHAITTASVMVLLHSRASNESTQVHKEVERADAKHVVIVSLRIDACQISDGLEYFLSAVQWIDATHPPLESHLAVLGDAVRALLLERGTHSSGSSKAEGRSEV